MRRPGCFPKLFFLVVLLASDLALLAVCAAEDADVNVRPTEVNPLRLGSKPRGQALGRWVEWRAGAKWEGEYQGGKRHGNWDGLVPIADDNYFAGPDYEEFTGPLRISVALNQNVPHGEFSATDSQGRPVLTWHFDQGMLEGKATWWHPNGQTRRQVTYRAGLLDGPVTEWNADGKTIVQETYREGRASSSHIDWHQPGRKRYEGYSHLPGEILRDSFDWQELIWTQTAVHEHADEERCGRWTAWHLNGQKKVQGNYQEGLADGRFTWWHENGQKMAEGEYIAGKREGLWRSWHANGRKHQEGHYKNGKPAAEWLAWTTEGRPAAVDRSKIELALDWDVPKTVEKAVVRTTAPTRPAVKQTVESSSVSGTSRAKAPAPATLSTPKASPARSARSIADVHKKPLPLEPIPTPQRVGPSDEFTLLGMFQATSPSPKAGVQSSKPRPSPTRDTPSNVVAEMFGLEQAPPPRPVAKPVRR